jgi:hypothetical protein
MESFSPFAGAGVSAFPISSLSPNPERIESISPAVVPNPMRNYPGSHPPTKPSTLKALHQHLENIHPHNNQKGSA